MECMKSLRYTQQLRRPHTYISINLVLQANSHPAMSAKIRILMRLAPTIISRAEIRGWILVALKAMRMS